MQTSNPAARTPRTVLSFSVDGLGARDELLLKSLVRLLDHRTHQHWAFRPEQADLRIVGETWSPQQANPAAATPLLTIGNPDHHQSHGYFLRLPLHADALEDMLNRLGALVMHARGLGLAATAGRSPAEGEEEFRLLRWPPAALFGTPVRLKLATLLAARPDSPLGLQQRSVASTQECAEFFRDLRHAGLLESSVQAASSTVSAAAPGGMAGGMAITAVPAGGSVQPHQQAEAGQRPAAAPPPFAPAPRMNNSTQQQPPLGLLARIRSRLGLLPSGLR